MIQCMLLDSDGLFFGVKFVDLNVLLSVANYLLAFDIVDLIYLSVFPLVVILSPR